METSVPIFLLITALKLLFILAFNVNLNLPCELVPKKQIQGFLFDDVNGFQCDRNRIYIKEKKPRFISFVLLKRILFCNAKFVANKYCARHGKIG